MCMCAHVYACICVHVCMCVCICVHVCFCMCIRQSTSDTFLYHSSSYFLFLFCYFLSQNLLLNLGLIDSARLARQWIPKAPCLHISSTKIPSLGCHTKIFIWFPGIKFRSSGLCGEHFPDSVISSTRLALIYLPVCLLTTTILCVSSSGSTPLTDCDLNK